METLTPTILKDMPWAITAMLVFFGMATKFLLSYLKELQENMNEQNKRALDMVGRMSKETNERVKARNKSQGFTVRKMAELGEALHNVSSTVKEIQAANKEFAIDLAALYKKIDGVALDLKHHRMIEHREARDEA